MIENLPTVALTKLEWAGSCVSVPVFQIVNEEFNQRIQKTLTCRRNVHRSVWNRSFPTHWPKRSFHLRTPGGVVHQGQHGYLFRYGRQKSEEKVELGGREYWASWRWNKIHNFEFRNYFYIEGIRKRSCSATNSLPELFGVPSFTWPFIPRLNIHPISSYLYAPPPFSRKSSLSCGVSETTTVADR